jgi:hypothetical protein
MNIFERKIDAHEFIVKKLSERLRCPDKDCDDCDDCEMFESLGITYARCTEWLTREYKGATEWMQNSLEAAFEPWAFKSWDEYAEYVGYSERTCRRYAIKGEDYNLFNGRFVSCQASADQFKQELDAGKRGNRPKKWMTDCTCPPNWI